MPRTFRVADLFCGAGGSSTGALRAISALGGTVDLVAVNHWDIAIETHSANHPLARHHCVNLDAARPEDIVPEGSLDLLMASPECVYFSRARGGKPVADQLRMSAWHVQRWASALDIRCILVENVKEFADWGPVLADGQPDKTKKGLYFQAWIQALWSMGYAVDWKLLNAADYGDATTRVRFFLQARKDGRPIRWPEPTHRRATDGMFGGIQKWRAARDVIDWTNLGASLLERPKPLSLKTRLRIARGLQRFGGTLAPYYIRLLDLPADDVDGLAGTAEPFVVANRNNNVAKSADEPLPTFTTAHGGGVMLARPTAEPFILGRHIGPSAKSADEPVPTATSRGAGYLVEPMAEPFVLAQGGGGEARSVSQPIPTIVTKGAISVIDPTVIPYHGQSEAASVDLPLGTITTHDRFGLCQPMAVPYGPKAEARSTDEPLPTILTKDRLGVATPTVEPFMTPGYGERDGQLPRIHSVADPVPTIAAQGHTHLVQPVVLSGARSVDPRRLVQIDGQAYVLDIRFRMLTNRELARAMGFDDAEVEYEFHGTASQVTKQIGNAVPVNLAAALVGAVLGDRAAERGAA